jgi:hypothetical protein
MLHTPTVAVSAFPELVSTSWHCSLVPFQVQEMTLAWTRAETPELDVTVLKAVVVLMSVVVLTAVVVLIAIVVLTTVTDPEAVIVLVCAPP